MLNTISVNRQGLLFAGGDNGMFRFCDWKTGYCFQEERTIVQPGKRDGLSEEIGSLDSEAGIFASTFDLTGTRLITCEADKSIKVRERMSLKSRSGEKMKKPLLNLIQSIWRNGNWSGERIDVSFHLFSFKHFKRTILYFH